MDEDDISMLKEALDSYLMFPWTTFKISTEKVEKLYFFILSCKIQNNTYIFVNAFTSYTKIHLSFCKNTFKNYMK